MSVAAREPAPPADTELTIVVPCFDEAARIDGLVARLTAVADVAVGPDRWQLLIVDDFSTDESARLLARHVADDARVDVIRPGIGTGKGAAVRAGLLAARGRLAFVTDADLAGAPEQLPAAIAALGDAAAVVGSRVLPGAVVTPSRRINRRLPAFVFRAVARRLVGVAASDPQCGFKLFRVDAVRPVAAALRTDGFAYELELLRRLADAGAVVVELPIAWSAGGESKVRVLTDGVAMGRDVVAIRRRLRRERRHARRSRPGRGGPAGSEPSPVVPDEPDRQQPHEQSRPQLSVVLPLYNEAAVIDEVIDELAERVLDLPAVEGVEVIVVDDHGTDGSAALVAARATADPRIEILRNDANRGHGRSVLAGLDRARGEWLLQLDSDGQVDLAGFAALWARRADADLWYGERVGRDDPLHRLLLTRAVNTFVSVLARRRIVDANAGYKLVHRPLYAHLRRGIGSETFAPSLLFVLGGVRARARVSPVAVRHRARRSGPSTLRLGRLATAVVTATRQTFSYVARPTARYAGSDTAAQGVASGRVPDQLSGEVGGDRDRRTSGGAR